MIRYVKVTGNIATPLPDRLADQATHSIECTEEQYAKAVNADYFVVEDGEPRHPAGQEESDRAAVIAKAKAISDLRDQRNQALMSVVVLVDGNEIWANPTEEQNISGRIRQMELAGETSCKWIQGDNVYPITKAQLEEVLSSGTAQCAKIYDDYIAAVEAL